MSSRTFKLDQPLMSGGDIGDWQTFVKADFGRMHIDYPLKIDRVYGESTRAATASLLAARGVAKPSTAMAKGVTPELRIKLRNKRFTEAETKRFKSAERVDYRRALRARFEGGGVARPVLRIREDSWGWAPASGSRAGSVHDGIDVGTDPKATLYAMVKSRVVRADNYGWWGKAPSGDVTLGDGIVILEVLETVGPFKKGMCIGYGHCEKVRVRPGNIVEAGDPIAQAGLAVVYHIHLMVNGGKYSKATGRGDRNPRALLDYAVKHS
jgi:murein DD-endopeptidase MepM/ murein hydrolase activator NlpD